MINKEQQLINEIEKVISQYQEPIELDALSLPGAIESIIARKTQECEELKNNLHIANTNHEAAEKECDRYLKALEEIKKVCIEDTREFADGTQVRYDSLDDILNIINKAKGDN